MTQAARPAVSRPSVLSLNISSKSALYAAYTGTGELPTPPALAAHT